MSQQVCPTPYPSNFAGRDEHADSEHFARALRPPPSGLHVLQNACPPVSPHPAGLDVLLFRGVLLVAYAAAEELVIARGTDLDALRRLRCPRANLSAKVTALAFRERDGAIAVAYGNLVVVFDGWSDRAKEADNVYTENFVETVLDLEERGVKESVVSLSWNADGDRLCVIADSIIVWSLDTSYMPVKYCDACTIPSTEIPSQPLSIGSISPNAMFIAASGLYSRVSYVWALPIGRPILPTEKLPCAEIVHGRSGISTMDWKRRGGGNPALMTADRDGTLRLWVRASSKRHRVSIPGNTKLASGADSWIEEIARSPHVERTPRAGATFLSWGGGGGVADDEGDAQATTAAHPLLAEGTAPKPSRCYHWIIRVAGGNACAWRVRGLDDRPRAEFTRIEPGTGDPYLGTDDEQNDDLKPPELPLRDVSVAAMKAVAPIPLTTASTYKIGLVKSYAISNGERRLRSPEPPEPPNLVAVFVLAVRNGLPYLARYDICPTLNMPAVCRARIGVGHSSDVVDLVTSEQTSNHAISSGGWLASRGQNGDVVFWRTTVATGAWEPLTAVAALPGPHTAVAFAPARVASPNLWEVGVFTCDSALGSLRLFQFVNFVNKKENASAHDIQIAKQVAVCHPRGRGQSDTVGQLIAMPLGKSISDPVSSARCALIGVRDEGRLCVWRVARRRKEEIVMEPSVLRFIGGRSEFVTCASTNELASLSRQIFVTGGKDGSAHVYSVTESEMDAGESDGDDSEDEESDEGVIWLRELYHLRCGDEDGLPVEKVEVIRGGSRILVMQADGRTRVWARGSSDNTSWHIELDINGQKAKGHRQPSVSPDVPCDAITSADCGASIGYDHDGNFSVTVLKRDGGFDRYRRVLGAPWECLQQGEILHDRLALQKHALRHIGKGVLVATNGRGVSVLATTKPDSHPLSFMSGAAGYSPSKAVFSQLLTGGRAWQVLAGLDELHNFVATVTKRKASESSYGAGRGLIPPPPSLSMLMSDKEDAPRDTPTMQGHQLETAMSPFQMKTDAKSLFARLMAKSDAKISSSFGGRNEDNEKSSENEAVDSGRDELEKLATRLKIVSLAGMTRSEQGVLAAIARASSSLRQTFRSLDSSGAKYALMAASHLEVSDTVLVPLPVVASAVHSSSSDALMDHFLPPLKPGDDYVAGKRKMWEKAKNLGAGWWVSSSSGCKNLAERIARSDFNSNRNADDAALWYVALGRRTALSALYRSQQNTRMSHFLRRNFALSENRLAAGKNAYVLVSKHRLELAVAFFILANDVRGALSLVRSRIKDDQLALFLSRILGTDEHDYVQQTLEHIVESSSASGDDHKKSIALWLSGKHEDALKTAGDATYPPPAMRLTDTDRILTGSLPSVVHSLSHVLAIVNRPPIIGTLIAKAEVEKCRAKACRALIGDGSPVAALFINFEMMRSSASADRPRSSAAEVDTLQNPALLAAVDTLVGRAVCLAGAVRSGATEKTLHELLLRDIQDLIESPIGAKITMRAVEHATFELTKEDEVDAGMAATCAALEALRQGDKVSSSLCRVVQGAQRSCLRVAVSRGLFHVQGALSLMHHPTYSSQRLSELLRKYRAAVLLVEKTESSRSALFKRLLLEFKGAVLALRFAFAFLRGDWPGLLYALRGCELSWQVSNSTDELPADREFEDSSSMTSCCSSLAPDLISVEALRHVASNPAILGISKGLVHIRRFRKVPSLSMAGVSAASTTAVIDESLSSPTLSVNADDPYAVIRIHPALSSTLAAACAAYLAAHLAAQAVEFARSIAEDSKKKSRNSDLIWQSESSDRSFRLIRAAEALEQIAEDAIAQWTPLRRFGLEVNPSTKAHPDEAAGAFVDLWSTLGCLPEYAPSLSEAATVAAAEMAAAASRAAIEAAEQKDGGRRRRRRREKRGERVQSVAKEGLKLFDTTSADSLFGAYPVRFSASAEGPWSGRGRHASLYREDKALFRTLCVSATDPPAVIVATPKGIQEIVPSSYTTMPAGFRSHYLSKRGRRPEAEEDERLKALARDRDLENSEENREEEDSFLSSYDGFGEGPYVPLELHANEFGKSRRARTAVNGAARKAIWRHQVHATTLASHPMRRRFASGGTDGVVRLWDFADPISLASFREDNYGRVSDLCFSAYGNTMLAVYSSGHVTIWDDPDLYNSRGGRGSRGSRAKNIQAFDNRAAGAGDFLDERHTIAVVGDPTAPPSVGHSLRIFDTREPNYGFHATWSAAVNHQLEARCLTLLEDRMRVVTGGLDGSISVVDIRTRTCVAELPAHSDEVTCLALEMPRGRALVSGSVNGEIKLWDSRTLLQLDVLQAAHKPTRHYWSGNGLGGFVGSYGTHGLALTDRSLISCGGDGVVKIWGPGWSDFDLNVL
ncbi:unnamed protein product [Chondrus crispus]|uniref:RAVE complex protein Rav1 C-terminal domain-containing protein n=1 Tax=Chondrus crispus TaxID=2769 RepID=R7QAI7_CHOCR|nr:unnamed protein product [Chondrus crispus]CDF35507.1 unnamed protein product [Chondrus crispus]|eukprot:XP_005715326.1 unnamed protein product [Chondrus crispus]